MTYEVDELRDAIFRALGVVREELRDEIEGLRVELKKCELRVVRLEKVVKNMRQWKGGD